MDNRAAVDRRTVLLAIASGAGSLAGGIALANPARAENYASIVTSQPTVAHDGHVRRNPTGLRGRGVVYDTGFFQTGVVPSTHEPFDPKVVAREMRIIRKDLNCNAVRIFGSDQDRLETAAVLAARAGLEVWYSPFTNDLDQEAMLAFLADAARRCERLRRRGNNRVVLTTGSELTFTMRGFIPGETFVDRLAWLTSGDPNRGLIFAQLPGKINAFLSEAVSVVRKEFGGQVTYPALSFEGVDWTPFDLASHDFYPNMVDGAFPPSTSQQLQGFSEHGKPVAITEIGCPAYTGASARAGSAQAIVEWDVPSNVGVRLNGDYTRNEDEQASYVTKAVDLCEDNGIENVFIYTFQSRNLPTRNDPREDVDVASYGIVKVLESGIGETFRHVPWEPKAGFFALAERYARYKKTGRGAKN